MMKTGSTFFHSLYQFQTNKQNPPFLAILCSSSYNTILSALAQGINTLNELYLHTGFSRAKISVYLKSLMELELVEKVFSYDTKGHANTRKGMYRIKNHAACFYYRFLYPHRSDAEMLPREVYYEKYVEKELKSFVDEYFKEICREYLEEENKKGKLPVACGRIGEWVGKKGSLDIVAGDENGNMLIGTCIYKKPLGEMLPFE